MIIPCVTVMAPFCSFSTERIVYSGAVVARTASSKSFNSKDGVDVTRATYLFKFEELRPDTQATALNSCMAPHLCQLPAKRGSPVK